MISVIGNGKSQFTVNGLVFEASIGVMGLLILIITVVLNYYYVDTITKTSLQINNNC